VAGKEQKKGKGETKGLFSRPVGPRARGGRAMRRRKPKITEREKRERGGGKESVAGGRPKSRVCYLLSSTGDRSRGQWGSREVKVDGD